MPTTVIGLFTTRDAASHAVEGLLARGFSREDIGLIAPRDYRGADAMTAYESTEAAGGAAVGAAGGAALGGVGGVLVSLVALALPGVGPIVVAGPLAAALAGAGVGAVAGGLVGMLSKLGVPQEEALYYMEGLRKGGALVSVHTSDALASTADQVLRTCGAAEIRARTDPSRRELLKGQRAP